MNEEDKREIWNKNLIKNHNGQWFSFDDLPQEAQNAAIIYQFGSGSRWSKIEKEHIEEARQELRERTRGRLWGFVYIPTKQVKQFVFQFGKDVSKDWKDFDSYHKWYVSCGDTPKHRKKWPIILSGFMDEFIQDGWHRMHCYIKHGKKKIPALLFP